MSDFIDRSPWRGREERFAAHYRERAGSGLCMADGRCKRAARVVVAGGWEYCRQHAVMSLVGVSYMPPRLTPSGCTPSPLGLPLAENDPVVMTAARRRIRREDAAARRALYRPGVLASLPTPEVVR